MIKKVDVCDIDAAMREWYSLGEDVFSRAQQNNPITRGVDVYTITPEIVMSRQLDRKPYELPDWTQFVIAASDINPGVCHHFRRGCFREGSQLGVDLVRQIRAGAFTDQQKLK